ncbi:hypothetical protein ACJZ2D_005729 [Fusarium nematophilum]
MAGRPPGGGFDAGSSNNRDNLLLDLDNDQPVYNDGQRSTLNDDDLMRFHEQNQDPQGRTSVSYDDFVGARDANQAAASRSGTGLGVPGPPPGSSPYLTRQYSQTSELGNYQRYADDFDDYPADGDSYYQHGGPRADESTPGLARNNARNRNSVLSLGGGFFGRVKNRLGMGQGYSEMDLPLTEPGHERGDSVGGGSHQQAQKSRFDMGNFKFGFGRSKPDPSTLGPRLIYLNNPPANAANKYVDNHISTAKYNVATFLPKFLFEQFSKFANIFFLFTAALQQIPNLSPTNPYTTIAPLIVVLLISAGKELVEDYRRKQADNALNTSKAQVLRGSTFQETKWINVAVGDIIRVESEEPFPADIVLLASSEPEGLCYIETANLDGETNLKIKQALPETSTMVSPSELSRLGGRIKSEQPNSSLYTYEATLTMQTGGGEKELALNPEQLLLRGATLRNTPWVHGVVVFTGHETKLMRNATAAPIKRTKVEKKLNWLVLLLVGILLVLSIVSTVGDLVQRKVEGDALSYLHLDPTNTAGEIAKTFFKDMVTYWVLFSALVPISLFVTVEMVKYWHGILINDDLDMYYDKTGTPATCRTSSLVEELGMVEYVFSDKTGTLTCNQMEFKQCSIAGIQYADDVPEDRRPTMVDGVEVGLFDFKTLKSNLKGGHETAPAIDHFLSLLATCHTVIPEMDEKGNIKYQAASPDEGALVAGAVDLGFKFTARKPKSVIIDANGQEFDCKLLSEDMMLLIVNEETAAATRDNLQKKIDAIRTQGDGTIEMETLALIIDGKSLTYALEKDLEKLFLDLAVMCKAVICCRVSPLQKALVVKLVKKYQKESILLAIGDGANDVSMIQAAHIGIGISGEEGLQAARSADVAIAQFRYLRKLLLVHGAWSYQRVSKTILFSFYKNITLYMTQFWYTFQNVFSGQVIYESWTLSFYNVFYTVFPPLALGILDQFISARLLDRYPQLYMMGQQNYFFRLKVFSQWIGNAIYHSIVLYIWSELFWYGDLIQGDGKIAGHWVWGTALYGAVLLTVLGKAALVTSNWTKYHVLAIPGSMAFWYVFIAVYGIVAPMAGVSMEYHGVVPKIFTSPVFWLQTVNLAVMCLLRDFVWKYAKRMYWPQTYHHIQEIQKYNIQDYRPRMEQFQKAIRKVRQVQRMRKQRGHTTRQSIVDDTEKWRAQGRPGGSQQRHWGEE